MKVLITGGAGYIGTELVNQLALAEEVDELVIYDNLSRGNRNLFIGDNLVQQLKLTFIQGDILDSRKLKQVLKGVDVVYHLAANVTTPFSDQNPHLFEQVNHWGTAELVYAIEKSDVKRLIYLSSVSVYGTSSTALKVDAKLDPQTFYGISKMRAEEHVERVSQKLETFIIRCGNVYGYSKSMRFDAVINRFMFEANFQNKITINGSGEQHRPFIHVAKVVEVLSQLLQQKPNGTTYNLVDVNLAVGEVVESVRQLYPDLEMLFVNQQMKMRELKVEGSAALKSLFPKKNDDLTEELRNFQKAFTF